MCFEFEAMYCHYGLWKTNHIHRSGNDILISHQFAFTSQRKDMTEGKQEVK